MSNTTVDWNLTTSNVTTDDTTLDLLVSLIPALMKTFLVILAGYIFGLTNLYPKEHAGAIGRLCGTLLLPVAVFDAMATLLVTPEAWTFLYAVAICKGGIFFVVLIVSLIVDRRKGGIGRAAIWSVFSTQSNDFALGLPIFNVLYSDKPTYVSFLYIVAPVNLVVLNPIAFILMEFSKNKSAGKKTDCRSIAMVLKQVFTNPLVLLTFAGLLVRLALWDRTAADVDVYSNYVQPVLSVVSSAFTGCALFSLGLLIVGKFSLLKKNSPLKAIIFILVKSLVLPILLKLVLDVLSPGDTDLSTAGFLYGIVPTASGVFTYCLQFGMNPDLIAISMVLGTIVSAPLMLSLGSMVAIAADVTFDASTFAQAVPYFKMIPGAFSIMGALFFVIASIAQWRRLNADARVFRACMITAATVLVICYCCLFPCQILLLPFGSDVHNAELHTVGAETLFLVNIFALTFYRAMIAAVAIATCFVLKHRIETGRELSGAEQRAFVWKIHLAVFLLCGATTAFIGAYNGVDDDSCVSPFSVVTSATTCAVQLLLVVANVVGLVWYNRLKLRLQALDEFSTAEMDMMSGENMGGSMTSLTVLTRTSPIGEDGEIKPKRKQSDDADDADDLHLLQNDGAESLMEKTEKSEPDDDGFISKDHPSMIYMRERSYTRRFSIIVYETCLCLLATIVLLLGVIDNDLLLTDTILFAITFVLAMLTYSSGIVLMVALGFPLMSCKRRSSSRSIHARATAIDDSGRHMDF